MKRNFRGDRLYKIIKIIVNIATVLVLLLALIRTLNFDEQWWLDEYDKCVQTSNSYDGFCYVYLDNIRKIQDENIALWIIGITLPIVFYGGSKLINYLFPLKSKKQH